MAQVFQRDDNGNVVDPPTNPDYERELTRARDSGDDAFIARVTEDYNNWRTEEVRRIEEQANGTVNASASDATTAGPVPGDEPADPEQPSNAALEQEVSDLRAQLAERDTATPQAPAGEAAGNGGQ